MYKILHNNLLCRSTIGGIVEENMNLKQLSHINWKFVMLFQHLIFCTLKFCLQKFVFVYIVFRHCLFLTNAISTLWLRCSGQSGLWCSGHCDEWAKMWCDKIIVISIVQSISIISQTFLGQVFVPNPNGKWPTFSRECRQRSLSPDTIIFWVTNPLKGLSLHGLSRGCSAVLFLLGHVQILRQLYLVQTINCGWTLYIYCHSFLYQLHGYFILINHDLHYTTI